ncbi:MAG: lysophospholipid acyltransferase family protein [Hyphomonadaceae bacterium]
MLRQLLGNPVFQFLIGRAIGGYMLLVGVTTRWTKINRQAVEPFLAGQGRLIACVWHGRFMQIHKLWAFGPGVPRAKMLISQSREGGVVAHASRTVGAEVIRGSAAKRGQSKGGFEAMRAMARHIEDGGIIAMTPDGPRGPRMRAKLGTVQLAKLARAQILPLTWATSNRVVMDSWDRFVLPLPFGRGALIWGNPVDPPSADADDAEMENVRQKLEAEMNRIAAEADRFARIPVIEPAPKSAPAAADLETAATAK